jgi:hypothetical protein
MFEKLNNWLNNSTVCADDVTADIARANYLKYQKKLNKKRKAYLKVLCRNIKNRALMGGTSVCTIDLDDERMSPEFVAELTEYFEQRGFEVKKHGGTFSSWLNISW